MKKIFFKIVLILPFLVFLAFFSRPVYSQDIEGATREVDRLGREKEELEGQLRRPPKKTTEVKVEQLPAKKEEEEEKFFIRKIKLVGCESFPPESFSALTSKYENKEVTLTGLDILAKDIEQAYLDKGVIAAVFVPPQDIKEGNVTLQVVEAKMGELQIQEHKYFNKKRVAYYWRIPSGKTLHYDRISKSLKMMNKNPDREVKSTLVAGKKPGTTDVVLIPETNFPAHFLSSYDREGITSSGKSRYTFGMRHNNFLGLDDMLLTGYTFGREFSGTYAYHNIPISPFGTSLVYGYSQSGSTPKKEFTQYGIKSTAKNASVSVYQDLYKKDNYLGEVYFSFDAKDKTTVMNIGTYNRDRLRIARLGGNFNFRDSNSVTYLSPEFSQGMSAFGASPHNNPLASRGAKPVFNKFMLGVQQRRNLPLNLQANLKVKSQFTHQKLAPQEEFSLGGINTVRGYPPDDYLADNAVLTSAELLIPSFFIPQRWRIPYGAHSLKEETTLVAFMDYGHGSRLQPSGTEKKSKNLLSIGAGARFNLFNQALLRLEWGFPIAANRSITESGNSRFHFSVDFQDRLPEEIERICKEIEENEIKQLAWETANEELSRSESSLRKKLEDNLALAKEYGRQGKLIEARETYAKILEISMSLYNQCQDYAREFFKKEEELKGYRQRAIKFSKLGRFEEAKQEWIKIIQQGSATPEPLTLDF